MNNPQIQSIENRDRNLVLLAKNTLIWLHQLSEKYNQPIFQLDQIPLDELKFLGNLGINVLWLIGIWERSPASRKIKHLYGREDLISSAYSIYTYEIARNLGGQTALESLKSKASLAGIELACDFVPNHTGLDSPWLITHPEWYISTEKSPKSEWRFNSPNLLEDRNIEINLEEGYYSRSGAAEVFRMRDLTKNADLYIYHGNDGTSMPWNDTAQLNYLIPQVREAVKQLILRLSRIFRIIRLDAAMTLIKQHYRRLWFPEPGDMNCIPTREQFSMSAAEFDRLMPGEFWQEVMDEVIRTSPKTLFLAEAFWLMERFFIEELGIHRVYNSAFMHNLRDENNASFRQYFNEILCHNSSLLERFVNFLTTPDEHPAAKMFGKSEKYFGACALMASLPGLPLFGHGQIEGLLEHYGMDVEKPFLQEKPDEACIASHNRLITPLLLQRERFSSADHLMLSDFLSDSGKIDENVIIFTNINRGMKSLIIFNNQPQSVSGTVVLAHCERKNRNASIQSPNLFNHALILPLSDQTVIVLTNLQTHQTLEFDARQTQNGGLPLNLPPYVFFAFDVTCK